MAMFKNTIFILFFSVASFCFSQEGEYIIGQLVDFEEKEPVPFATIRVKDKALGVITNIDGTFKIPVRFRELGESLVISCMGYKTIEVQLEDLYDDQSNIILIQPGAFELSGTMVFANFKKLTAKQIVRIAVNRIASNYPLDPFSVTGYYRDYQVKNGAYTNLSEAIIEIADLGFKKTNILDNSYHLYSYNQNTNFEVDSFARQPYDYARFRKIIPYAKLENDGGNEFLTLRMHDAIRNYGLESFSFIDDITTDFLDNHRFKLIGKTSVNQESVYRIDFNFIDDNYRVDGKIFINIYDFAIHQLDYTLYKRIKPGDDTNAINEEERFSDGFKKTNSEILYHIQTEYSRGARDKMYLNYISFYNKVLLQRPGPFRSKFVVDLADKSFRIRLNKLPAKPHRIKNTDFNITYKGKYVPIEDFYFLEDERTFIVCPYIIADEEKAGKDYIFKNMDAIKASDVAYSFTGIKDLQGNKLDTRQLEYIHQYREFFSQEVQADRVEPDTTKLLLKNLPLNSKMQPIFREKVKNDFWKNTPLPELEPFAPRLP